SSRRLSAGTVFSATRRTKVRFPSCLAAFKLPFAMPTPSRPLTNDYRDCRLIKLDAADPNSPLVVMQEGYVPNDPKSRMQMFYLQRDGFWIDEIARSTRPDSEAGDVVFESSTEAMAV